MMADVEHDMIVRPGERIRVVTRPDFTETDGTPRGEARRMHLFSGPDGRETQCAGKTYCRECIRENAR